MGTENYIKYLNDIGIVHPFEKGFEIVVEETNLQYPDERIILGVCIKIEKNQIILYVDKNKKWESTAVIEILLYAASGVNEDFEDLDSIGIMRKFLEYDKKEINFRLENKFDYWYVKSLLVYIITNDHPDDFYKKKELEKI